MNRLRERPIADVLCYPKHSPKEAQKRIRELKHLGVNALQFEGEKKILNVSVLGKGCVGILVKACVNDRTWALKIRRVDADRSNMQHESDMLKAANEVQVGPSLKAVSENFLLMEYIEGTLFPRWIEKLTGKRTRNRLRQVLKDILEQCWRLDRAGLDHGELSRAPKHIIVDKNTKAHIVDFETASVRRRVANVTAMCQYLFIGSATARIVQRKLGKIDREKLQACLRKYKREVSREKFNKILSACNLMK